MWDASDFRDIVFGRRRGLAAALARASLRVLEVPYSIGAGWRNRQFDRARREIHQVGVPVVSVGNLTVGGTGKTPMIAWLARWFRQRDLRVTLISRGYKAESGSRNDEALELELQLPDVPHVQNSDRVAAAKLAIEEFDCQLILLDDAFQHRRIHRDLNIVLLDALEPFGNGHLLPRGTLRESARGLSRADIVCLSRCDAVDAETRTAIRRRANELAPEADWVEVSHEPDRLINASGQAAELSSLSSRPVAAFCGIGNPDGFRHTLESLGYEVAAFRALPDHHAYTREDIESLSEWAGANDVSALVCTRKDLVKIRADRLGSLPLWSVSIAMAVHAGQRELETRLETIAVQCERSD